MRGLANSRWSNGRSLLPQGSRVTVALTPLSILAPTATRGLIGS
jgi:hypothetical protein